MKESFGEYSLFLRAWNRYCVERRIQLKACFALKKTLLGRETISRIYNFRIAVEGPWDCNVEDLSRNFLVLRPLRHLLKGSRSFIGAVPRKQYLGALILQLYLSHETQEAKGSFKKVSFCKNYPALGFQDPHFKVSYINLLIYFNHEQYIDSLNYFSYLLNPNNVIKNKIKLWGLIFVNSIFCENYIE